MSSLIKKIIRGSDTANTLINKILSGENCAIKKLAGSLKSLICALILAETERPLLIVLPEEEEAEVLWEHLSSITDKNIGLYPGGEEEPDTPLILNPRRAGWQAALLRDAVRNEVDAIITTAEGIGYRLPDPVWFNKHCIELSLGSSFDIHQLIETLLAYGYTRESMVERPGEISLRGGILDVFPFTGESPYRFEFFGNEIDSMRLIDIETQRSKEIQKVLTLAPTSIFWQKRHSSLLSYFDNPLIFLQDQDLILGKINHTFHVREPYFIQAQEIAAQFRQYQILEYHTLQAPADCLDMGAEPWIRSGTKVKDIKDQLYGMTQSYKDIYIVCEDSYQKERIQDYLDITREAYPQIHCIIDRIHQGFLIPRSKIAVITAHQIWGRKRVKRRKKGFGTGVPIRELSALKPGDYVVHIDHGIGVYQGLDKITVKDSTRECLKIVYKDGDRLYVSVDKMQRVQKYSGREGVEPVINKLGGDTWERTKQKTKESIMRITQDLIKLYSQRHTMSGYTFSRDTVWQQELDDSFEYEETLDQKKVIEEVKRDMESPRVMDRLISGDVGFGKTEVAVRAAFKAVNDSKQVAVLVPTTILALQHSNTFKERLGRFPVRIEMLSRFQNRKEQKQIVTGLKQGKVDMVIGTHRLFSSDVEFKDLGLLIIDEEQRFGVKHKEKIKMLKRNVDVLALSATPIPRTLQFSLLGIRDMSHINTPPEHRLSIITEVIPFQEQVIVEAVQRERNRGGQIFFVHNRVQSIQAVAEMIKRLVPEVRLAVAHGQMRERDLEKVMIDFGNKKYDCLVATMIIESGLDLPNANTLIVHRADRMGLGQLYQLRGRVGRSDKRAYAYLLTPPFHCLSKDALRRLRTIEEFTELGSGLQIALRDLEIRGAGNLLGVKQSGNIDAVGFDLYMKLVKEAVRELKSEKDISPEEKVLKTECQVEIGFPAYIPDTYVASEAQRVNLYRSLATAETLEEITILKEEFRDRFGILPPECQNLLKAAELRLEAEKVGIKRLFLDTSKLLIYFDKQWADSYPSQELLAEKLSSMVDSSPVPIRFKQDEVLGIEMEIKGEDPFNFTKKMLQCWM